ncbi:MAG: alginate lyase family protein [Planctomycetota bacterium]|jgi:hypothetical protein|nr:alginate lyase family protein [Planctomycetota bacterium]MDP7250162.1 alginate lyase family protein [Planctomycetota bacterium]
MSDKGPRITDQELFSALDLDRPGLNEVRAAVAESDFAAAKEALARHIHERKEPRWFFDWRDRPILTESTPAPPEERPHEEADDLCQHIFGYEFVGTAKTSIQFGEKIDWGANPTKGEAKTLLWNEALNRHYHFEPLSMAYWESGDEKYARELAAQWLDWIEQNPRPLDSSGNVQDPSGCFAWQTLTTGMRLEDAWPNALYRCLGSPAFNDEAITAILKSVSEQAKHLIRWPTAHNWLTEECMGVFTAGMLFPEFKEAKEWRRIALERLYKQFDDEVYPDGLEYELAAGYCTWVLKNFYKILDLVELNGLQSELPEGYLPRLEKMFEYPLYASMPDGTIPGLNDSGNMDVTDILKKGHQLFPHREDFLYVATSRKEGCVPGQTSSEFPYAGHYVMRSSWDEDACYLLFDSGPYGSAHQHEDKLHFVLYANGRQHILDPGNYSYDESRWRRYVLTTPAHNTLMVDGHGQNRRAKPETHFWPRPWTEPAPTENNTKWESTEEFDYVVGDYRDGYGPENDTSVTHTRRILFVKNSNGEEAASPYFIILDTLTATDEQTHLYESLFHLDTRAASIDDETQSVRTENKNASDLVIFPLAGDDLDVAIVCGREDPVQGWANHPWRPVPTAVFSKQGKSTVRMLCVLCPIPQGQSAPIVSVDSIPCRYVSRENHDAGEAIATRITFSDGRMDYFAQSGLPGEELHFDKHSTTGEAALVQTAADGAVISSYVSLPRAGHC